MEVVYQRCAGVDVHQRFLVVCLSVIEAGQRRKEIRSFRTETTDLLALRTWLMQEQCSAVGMESTGVYWMPVYRRLEGFFELIVANAQHMRVGPWPKNGCAGCRLDRRRGSQHGLLTASFVPSQEQQDVRDLTRLRVSLVQERARLVNRVRYPSSMPSGASCPPCSAIFSASQENGSYKPCVQERVIRCV